jgi:uncharacterized membrane protein YbhN (UPF0104 family)
MGEMTDHFPRRVAAGAKIVVLAVVVAVVVWKLTTAWQEVGAAQLRAAIDINWRWALLSLLGFGGMLLTSATAWIWLLRHTDLAGSLLQLYGAYCFSQMGKYVPGKITLLLMRLERTRRLGVDGYAVSVSTILENATYMISGAAVGMLVLLRFAVARNGPSYLWLLVGVSSSVLVLLAAIHPSGLYRFVNPVLRKFGRPEIAPDQRLSMRTLLVSSIMMLPCWLFGGFALWATIRCLIPVPVTHFWGLVSAFALSVLAGMVSFLPGGLGVREIVQGVFLLPVVSMSIVPADASHAKAQLIVTLVVVLLRILQIAAEAGLGLLGGLLTASSLEGSQTLQRQEKE